MKTSKRLEEQWIALYYTRFSLLENSKKCGPTKLVVQAILWFSLSNIHQKTTLVDNTTVQREKLLITSIITKIKPKIIKCDKLRYIKDSETKKKHHVQLKVCITNLIPKVGYELKSHDVTYQRYKDINKNGNKHNLNNIYETKKIYALLVNRLKKRKFPTTNLEMNW